MLLTVLPLGREAGRVASRASCLAVWPTQKPEDQANRVKPVQPKLISDDRCGRSPKRFQPLWLPTYPVDEFTGDGTAFRLKLDYAVFLYFR